MNRYYLELTNEELSFGKLTINVLPKFYSGIYKIRNIQKSSMTIETIDGVLAPLFEDQFEDIGRVTEWLREMDKNNLVSKGLYLICKPGDTKDVKFYTKTQVGHSLRHRTPVFEWDKDSFTRVDVIIDRKLSKIIP